MRPIDIFHIGPQKSGTTWLYENLKQHPEIAAPLKDTIHYFDIHYAKNRDWLKSHFEEIKDNQKLFDPTFTAIRSINAIERIHKHNPKALIALTLRNPIDRAWSHYWHEYKKGMLRHPFNSVLKNYDLFQNWIEPGLPVQPLKKLFELFDKKQLHIINFEDIKLAPEKVLEDIFEFYGVDKSFKTKAPTQKVNQAGTKRGFLNKAGNKGAKIIRLDKISPEAFDRISGLENYKRGVEPEFRQILLETIRPDIDELEKIIGKDLSHWT